MNDESGRATGWYPAPDGLSEIYWTGDAWGDVRAKMQRSAGWYPAPDGLSEIFWNGDGWSEVRTILAPGPSRAAPTTTAPRGETGASARIERSGNHAAYQSSTEADVSTAQSTDSTAPSIQGTSGTSQAWKPGDVANGHVLTAQGKWVPVHAHPDDAAALEAYRQQALRYRESITGWKPLVFWYGFWSMAFGIGTISALFSGDVGVFFVGLVVTGLLFLYARYLFRGGTRRFWFVVF